MRAIQRQLHRKLFLSNLHSGRNLKKVAILLSTQQEFKIRHLKFHTMVCHRMKVSSSLDSHYNIEEDDGFEMVLVRAPPGASESTAPGHIEWEKTVGSKVTAGEVVCRIRFKEERTLDIKTPVTGIVAVRRKNEGDSVAHGDELFKIRLDASEDSKSKKKRKKKKFEKDYYEEEEELVGKSGLIDKKVKVGLKSSFLGSRSLVVSEDPDPYQTEPSSLERQKRTSQKQEPPKPTESFENNMDPYRRDNLQSRMGLLPQPYSQPVTVPISQLMTTINEVNMEDTLNFIDKFAGIYEVKYGNKPCLRSMYIKTAGHALKLNKELNIKLINDERVETNELEITIVIRHLKVVVFHTVKNVDKMSYVEISRLIFEIEQQIAAGTYKNQKGERGFTVSPEWEVDSLVGTPTYSKTCTLGLHNIIKRPIFEENKIIAYPMMYVSLTYDKKLIDDENAIEYLKCFKQLMEDPRHILVHSS